MTDQANTTTERVLGAKDAVEFFWSMRHDLPDTTLMNDAVDAIRIISGDAKREGRRITDIEWLNLAYMVNEACDDDGMPRLFDI